MAEIHETGHAVNTANFQNLIELILSWGARYKPPKIDLKLPALQGLNVQVQAAAVALEELKGKSIEPQKQHNRLSDQIDAKARGIIKTMEVLDIEQDILSRARGLRDLITGANVSKMSQKRKKEAAEAKEAGLQPGKSNSVSKQGFISRLDNFSALVAMTEGIIGYDLPKEDEYAQLNLRLFLQTVKEAGKNSDDNETPLMLARDNRNRLLYDGKTGAVAIAIRVKKDVSRSFKTTSVEYKQISSIKLRKLIKL